MYRVLIVDDEEPVLDSFKFIFENHVEDFTLCGQGRTGQEAIRMVGELQPHLVFMDIQMPGTDGMEAIKILRPLYPQTVFILATAYERFDIAQKAIKLGIFSYLVKPVSKNKILEELKKVKLYLDEQQEQSDYQLQDEAVLEKTRKDMLDVVLSGLIWRSPDEEEWSRFKKLFHLNTDRASIFLLGGFPHLDSVKREQLCREIFQKIQYKFHCLSAFLGDRMVLFFPEERSLQDLENQVRRLLKDYKEHSPQLGVGDVYDIGELSLSFAQAYKPFSDAPVEQTKKNELEERADFARQLINEQPSQGQVVFIQYWERIFKNFPFIPSLAKMVSLITLLYQELESSILVDSTLNYDPAEKIMSLTDVSQWKNWSDSFIQEFYELLEMQRNRSYPKPLKKALSFIAEHFDTQLQLSGVAQECNVSGSYLSRLFSEHLDIKFIDYVNRFRIKKAVQLLKEESISIKEASFRVGYQDPNYFSRIFRKIMGFSPSDLEKGVAGQ